MTTKAMCLKFVRLYVAPDHEAIALRALENLLAIERQRIERECAEQEYERSVRAFAKGMR